jgi:hypothetical protein
MGQSFDLGDKLVCLSEECFGIRHFPTHAPDQLSAMVLVTGDGMDVSVVRNAGHNAHPCIDPAP